MYVAPSILSADFGNLANEINAVCDAGADLLHIDVMDGHFVPNLTIGPVVLNAIKKVSKIPLDVHLMVKNVQFFAEIFAPLKPKFMSFHIEEEKHPLRLIDFMRKNDILPAIVLNPHSPLCLIEYILPFVDMVLLMSVNPGFGGQKFIQNVLSKIEKLRKIIDENGYKCMIEVDGGINGLNIAEIESAGADIVVAGSYIFSSNDYKTAIDSLKI